MKAIKRFQRHIEETEWDEYLLENDRYLRGACWAVIIIAVIYFGGVSLKVLMG